MTAKHLVQCLTHSKHSVKMSFYDYNYYLTHVCILKVAQQALVVRENWLTLVLCVLFSYLLSIPVSLLFSVFD